MYNLDDPNNENSFYMKLSLDALLVTINQSNKTCINICFELFFEELQAAGSILRTYTTYVKGATAWLILLEVLLLLYCICNYCIVHGIGQIFSQGNKEIVYQCDGCYSCYNPPLSSPKKTWVLQSAMLKDGSKICSLTLFIDNSTVW